MEYTTSSMVLKISVLFLLSVLPVNGQEVTMADHDIGNIRFSVSDGGKYGWSQGQISGSGFVYPIDNVDHLFEGSLIAGCDSIHVSHSARMDPSGLEAADWRRRPGGDIVIHTPGLLSDQDGWSKFADTYAPNPMNVEVVQRSTAYRDSAHNEFVIVELTLRNMGIKPSNDIGELYVGMYMDWDVQPFYGTARNYASVDTVLDVGYMWSEVSDIHCGVHVLTDSGLASFDLINNQDGSYQFTREEYWHSLSGGIQNLSGDLQDWSYVISTGPFDLPAGESITVALAVLAGESLPDLLANLGAANEAYLSQFDPVSVTVTPDTSSFPQGGILGLVASAMNNTGEPLSMDGWTEVILPGGMLVSPVIIEDDLTLNAGQEKSKRLEHDIPLGAPLGGLYTYCVSVGEFPDFIFDQDCFDFEIVSPSD
jgi:hypothetical protein